jgi:hypothetical protein
MATITYPRRQFEWYDVVELTGPEGRQWMTEYRLYKGIVRDIADSLVANRKGDLAGGTALLERAAYDLDAAGIGDPTIRAVLDRWYFGALGFSQYRRGMYAEADATMAIGQEVVMGALGRWFLVFLADETVDFYMHRARVARCREHWDEMRTFMGIARAMREGTRPYHVLHDGTSIGVAQVRDFFASLEVPEGAKMIAPHLEDAETGWRDWELTAREIVRIPGFVIYQ